jgi:hypothetical protein
MDGGWEVGVLDSEERGAMERGAMEAGDRKLFGREIDQMGD